MTNLVRQTTTDRIHGALEALIGLMRRQRRATSTVVYSALTLAALAAAYVVRFEFTVGPEWTDEFWPAAAILVTIRLGTNYYFSLGISAWRFVGTRDVIRLLGAVTVGSAVFLLVTWGGGFAPRVPRSVILLEWVFSGYATAGMWVLYRLIYERYRSGQATSRTRVLVVGAGEAGQMLVREMRRSSAGYVPLGFVDDDPFKWGTRIHGVEVIGSTDDLGSIAQAVDPDEIILAMPSASPDQIRTVVERCEDCEAFLKILPGINEVLKGEASLGQLREVELEDLLGRTPVDLELPALSQDLVGRTVLVTGAAGSIGSELVRQIVLNRPRRVVMFDQAETPLFYLEHEMKALAPDVELIAVVGSVTEEESVERVFELHRPQRVFHAAAYKHVPMMESNPLEAARTNVFGTFLVAERAGRTGAETFVLVSTDKAVRPANIMGATKHFAEKVVLGLQGTYPSCSFGAVRFGNVLGSNGSVIPLFRRQMERGEPLTVTHDQVTRYFMTIPEAVQLILQASLLPELRGNVAMLDMGEPVLILDLARRLLRLSGTPAKIGKNIIVTGLRPGEKLHEELADPHESVTDTDIERVRIVQHDNGHLPPGFQHCLARRDAEGILSCVTDSFPGLASHRSASAPHTTA